MARIGSRGGVDEGFAQAEGVAVRQGSSKTLQRDPWENMQPSSKFWINPFPLAPYNTERKTVATRISNDIYSFEQEHGPAPSFPPLLSAQRHSRKQRILQMRVEAPCASKPKPTPRKPNPRLSLFDPFDGCAFPS